MVVQGSKEVGYRSSGEVYHFFIRQRKIRNLQILKIKKLWGYVEKIQKCIKQIFSSVQIRFKGVKLTFENPVIFLLSLPLLVCYIKYIFSFSLPTSNDFPVYRPLAASFSFIL